MKIINTSDWHVGRRWKGIQRLDEHPPAETQQLMNRFLVRVGRTGVQMIVIAGNHDDPFRLDARSLFTEFVNVQIIGRPRPASQGRI